MSDLRFQKLTPTSNVDLNVYEEGFEFIFSNDDIRNIAVSGPDSSGKSSLLESYKKKYPPAIAFEMAWRRVSGSSNFSVAIGKQSRIGLVSVSSSFSISASTCASST